MRSYAYLLYGFCSRNFTMIRRYPLNFVGTIITHLMVFLMIFVGGQAIAPTEFGESLGAIIVGYFVLSTVLNTFFSMSGLINNEAKYGTLEQLYISEFSFPIIMSAAVVAGLVLNLGMAVVNLGAVLVITGETLTLNLLTVGPLLLFTLLYAVGLSFLFGGIALLFKRIRSLFSIVQFLFIGIISLALTDLFWPRLLPVGQGAAMLHDAMANGRHITEFPIAEHALLVGTTALYLVIGYLSFHIAQYRARQRGLLDDY